MQIDTDTIKNVIILLIALKATFCFGQKKYKFDYAVETEITFYKEDSIKKKVIYLTNSKDNSYFVELTSKDSLYYQLIFTHYNKLYSDVSVLKSEINNAEFININCEFLTFRENKYKNATERYDFFILEDTIIDNQKCKAYKLKSILPLKKRIRRGAGTNMYIIDSQTYFHLPLLTHPTAYEEWKLHKSLPNGLFLEKKHINVSEEDHSSEKLISYALIDKSIIISKDCYDSE